MEKHDYTALTTFRGWSEEDDGFIIGSLILDEQNERCYISIFLNSRDYDIFYDSSISEVHPDSIGTYTGKDDKGGKPIFCGVAGAKYGGDNLKWDEIIFYTEWSDEDCAFVCSDGKSGAMMNQEYVDNFKIISTQWQEHQEIDNAE